MRHAMIMAGGAGIRLWPMSRTGQPKQLIRFIHRPGAEGPVSLLELAAARLKGLVPAERRYICTGEGYRSVIRAALPDFPDENVLGEPEGRDTVNAVGFGAAVFSKADPDAVFAVLTADHLIEPDETFRAAMEKGFELVERDPSRLVTFAIRPTHPATGFGYVERAGPVSGGPDGAFRVARFVEKPDLPRAQAYVESGDFFWNSGMFIFHAGTFMRLLKKHRPDSHAGLARLGEAWNTEHQQEVLDDVYPKLPKLSVDYAIMAPASSDDSVTICAVEMDVRWLDVGSWPSYAETIEPDARGNRVAGVRCAAVDSQANTVIGSSEAHTIALLGCRDLIVVHTPDATLVMPRSRAQDLKHLHAQLDEDLR